MSQENPLAGGFYFDKPREGAPEFIKARISVKVEDAIETLKKYKNDAGYVNLELLKKKDGTGHYLQVNTYGLNLDPEAPVSKSEPRPAPEQPDEEWRKDDAEVPF